MTFLVGHDALPSSFFLGFFVWSFGTATGGGPFLFLFLPAASCVAPVTEVNPSTCAPAGVVSIDRVCLFRQHIQWRVLARLLPGSLLGAAVGVQIFAAIYRTGCWRCSVRS